MALKIPAVDDRERQRAQDVGGQPEAMELELASQTGVAVLGVIGHRVIILTGARFRRHTMAADSDD